MKEELVRQRIKHLVEQGGLAHGVIDKHHATKQRLFRALVAVVLTALMGFVLHMRLD